MYMMNEFTHMWGSMAAVVFGIAMWLFIFIGYWRIFEKAGRPGWAVIIPIYNLYCAFSIAWGNGWIFLLMLIPFVNIIVGIMTCLKLSEAFGKGVLFAVGLMFLPTVFAMILGWGSAVYYGPRR